MIERNIMKPEHIKVFPVIYCICILIAPFPVFSFSAQTSRVTDTDNGFFPTEPC